jgi:hypothetical protein
LGIIYQLCVAPGVQRKLVGAALVREVFARSAYGCRLYCCWCAQDLAANHFWEAMGFVPIAFRAGSSGKKRVHIFWQRRINADDATTRYWYPAQTNAGAIREDRLVFPIPPGVHWQDVQAVVLPGQQTPQLEDRRPRQSKSHKPPVAVKPVAATLGRLQFAPPVEAKPARPKREPRAKVKNDPKFVAAARELRDRWLEHASAPGAPGLFQPAEKYRIARALTGESEQARAPVVLIAPETPRHLPAAA